MYVSVIPLFQYIVKILIELLLSIVIYKIKNLIYYQYKKKAEEGLEPSSSGHEPSDLTINLPRQLQIDII